VIARLRFRNSPKCLSARYSGDVTGVKHDFR